MQKVDNSVTGAADELRVRTLFVEWGWNPGQHQIDRGYDLFVTPNHDTHKSRAFYVQVKGTTTPTQGTISASVSRQRLRQYAEALAPVFIVRATSDHTLYWIHAQRWCEQNQGRLAGSGYRAVRFDPTQRLDCRETFETVLAEAFTTLTFREVADAASQSSLVGALPSMLAKAVGGDLTQAQQAASAVRPAHLMFTAKNEPENVQRLREAIEFGAPRTITVENLRIVDADRRDTLGPLAGQLTLHGPSSQVDLFLYPGKNPSLNAVPLVVPAEHFVGRTGWIMSNERLPTITEFRIGMSIVDTKMLNITFGVRTASLLGRPLKDIHQLGFLLHWAEQVLAHDALNVEIHQGRHISVMELGSAFVENFYDQIRFAQLLGRIHAVAKVIRSKFVLPDEFTISPSDAADIDLTFALLRGDRRAMKLDPFEMQPMVEIDIQRNYEILMTTNFMLTVSGQEVGLVPAKIELPGYAVSPVTGSTKLRIAGGAGAKAWVSYAEHLDRKSVSRRA